MNNQATELLIKITVYLPGKIVHYAPGCWTSFSESGEVIAANISNNQPYTSRKEIPHHHELTMLCLRDAAGKLFLKDNGPDETNAVMNKFRKMISLSWGLKSIILEINHETVANITINNQTPLVKACHEIEKLLPHTEYTALDPRQYAKPAITEPEITEQPQPEQESTVPVSNFEKFRESAKSNLCYIFQHKTATAAAGFVVGAIMTEIFRARYPRQSI